MGTQTQLDKAVRDSATDQAYPDGEAYRSLAVADVAILAGKYQTTAKAVELAALELGIVPERYARNQRTLSCADQGRLLQSRVAVVGQGGLGGTVTELLTRLGVGELVLMDGDQFEDSNLNRQLLSTTPGLDQPKTAAARERVTAVNPAVTPIVHNTFLTPENAATLLADSQVVVDCLDNLPTRFTVAAAARTLGIPMVSAAVAGMAGHVTVFYPEDEGLERLYGKPGDLPPKGAETALGTIPFAVAAIASLECAEVTKILLGHDHVLRNQMVVVDMADNTMEVLTLA